MSKNYYLINNNIQYNVINYLIDLLIKLNKYNIYIKTLANYMNIEINLLYNK